MHSISPVDQPDLDEAPHGSLRYPVLGILGAVIGTLLAIRFIPDDPEPKGALVFSGLALSLGLALAPIVALCRDLKSILRGEHLLALGAIYWLLLDLIQGAYELGGVGKIEVRTAFAGIGLFVVCVWIGSLGRPWRMPRFVTEALEVELPANAIFGLAVAAFSLGMFNYAFSCNFNLFEMFSYLGENRWAAPWGRAQLGGWDAFLDHMRYFGYLLPALAVMMARRAGWLAVRTLLVLAMAIVVALFIAQSGSRRILGVVLGMAIILWMLTESRLNTRHMLAIGAAAAGVLVAMQVMIKYRGVGFEAMLEESGDEAAADLEYIHVDDNFLRFSQIVQLIPDYFDHVYHKYLVWVLVRPVPRVLWPGKPVDPGFDLTEVLGVQGVSYSCSVIGELYISGGLVAIALGGWIFGRLSSMVTGLLTHGTTFGTHVVYAISMMALFAGLRSMLEVILTSYVVLAWIVLNKVWSRTHTVPAPAPG